jgi:hypothetical protein
MAINVERGPQGRVWACVGNKCRLVRTQKGYVHPKKRQRSWTKKGRKDFTTKKGNKFFNRRSRRQRRAQGSKIKRGPYRGGCSGCVSKLEKWGSELGGEADTVARKVFDMF